MLPVCWAPFLAWLRCWGGSWGSRRCAQWGIEGASLAAKPCMGLSIKSWLLSSRSYETSLVLSLLVTFLCTVCRGQWGRRYFCPVLTPAHSWVPLTTFHPEWVGTLLAVATTPQLMGVLCYFLSLSWLLFVFTAKRWKGRARGGFVPHCFPSTPLGPGI